jgi:TonB family protein
MTNFIITVLVLASSAVSAQDTLWFDAKWEKADKKDASYYRLTSSENGKYLVKDMYSNHNPQMIAQVSELEPLTKNGHCTYFNIDGSKESEGNYENNLKRGIWTRWADNGKDSSVIMHDANGSHYIRQMAGTDNNPMSIVERMPQYPGGMGEMVKFIQENLVYPKKEKENGIEGTCYVTFVVEKDGSLSNVRVLRGITDGPGYDAEAVRVVSAMPAWAPGTQDGVPVRVQFNLPIKFTLISRKEARKKRRKVTTMEIDLPK